MSLTVCNVSVVGCCDEAIENYQKLFKLIESKDYIYLLTEYTLHFRDFCSMKGHFLTKKGALPAVAPNQKGYWDGKKGYWDNCPKCWALKNALRLKLCKLLRL